MDIAKNKTEAVLKLNEAYKRMLNIDDEFDLDYCAPCDVNGIAEINVTFEYFGIDEDGNYCFEFYPVPIDADGSLGHPTLAYFDTLAREFVNLDWGFTVEMFEERGGVAAYE